MKALVIDAGNTRLALRGLDGEDQLPRLCAAPGTLRPLTDLGHVPTPHSKDELERLPQILGPLLDAAGSGPVVLSSVVPAVTAVVRSLRPGVTVIDHRTDLPFALAVGDPAAVGADRYCNVAAAVAAGLDSAMVIDAGTATTFDVLSGGKHLGGIIAPGMALAAEALGIRAARLPEEPFAEAPLIAATTTAAAMRAGAWHAGRGGVAAVAGGLLAAHGPLQVVVTGGLGSHLVDLGFHDGDWTLRGAAWLALGRPAAG
ncbi:MAG: type III pantothenate kinase [bacterium]|nr:type III pantothenate kinase [bacterium]